MSDYKQQFEKETGMKAIEEHSDMEGVYEMPSVEYTEWLTDRLDRMRKALEFYADKNNYDITEIEGYSMETTIDADGGDTARQALSQTKQEDSG